MCIRMGQDELMRISRALAMFRPSFISTMVSLTEEDLIYMEKCVQRTLMVRFDILVHVPATQRTTLSPGI